MARSAQLKQVRWRHELVIDWLLANPHEPNKERLCEHLGVSRGWLSVVMNSDAFKARFEERRRENDERFGIAIHQRLHDLALKTIDHLEGHIDRNEMAPRDTIDATRTITQALGYGAKKGSEPVVQFNTQTNVVVDRGVLERARESMRRAIGGGVVLDGDDPALEGG